MYEGKDPESRIGCKAGLYTKDMKRVGLGQTLPNRLTALLLRPWAAGCIVSRLYGPGTRLIPKCAVGCSLEIGLNDPSLEGKSNSEQEDKQVSGVIWFIWLFEVVIPRQFGVLTLYHLSFYFLILVLIFSYLYLWKWHRGKILNYNGIYLNESELKLQSYPSSILFGLCSVAQLVSDSATSGTAACQAPPFMEFSMNTGVGLPLPAPGDLPNPVINPMSPGSLSWFFTSESPGKFPSHSTLMFLWIRPLSFYDVSNIHYMGYVSGSMVSAMKQNRSAFHLISIYRLPGKM